MLGLTVIYTAANLINHGHGPRVSPCPKWSAKSAPDVIIVFSAGVPGLWHMTVSVPDSSIIRPETLIAKAW
jgi:hypothetical protein